MIGKAIFNREPLQKSKFAPLPLTAVRPAGWLEEQLRIQAEGLSGHLHDIWPYVGDECAWLGGPGDAWERAPYYLDGLVPLAYLLDDKRLIYLAQRYIECALKSQREDGFFGPEQNADWWPRMVFLKAMIQYYSVTADDRVPLFMLKYFAYQYKHIDEQPLTDWAVARGAENMLCVIWLYDLTGKPFLLKLCDKLERQTLDWSKFCNSFSFPRANSRNLPWKQLCAELAASDKLRGEERPLPATQYHYTHVVNVAMGLKLPAIRYMLRGSKKERSAFFEGYAKLMKYHGVASGIFTGDEHINGASPTQGTELCAVVELMFTLETLGWALEDARTGDILEKLAFGALPATISADMRTHQYDQQVNQVRVSRESRPWYNNDDSANTFGIEPHFGCCTANMHQGWPKFVESLWMATEDDGLACASLAPCKVRFRAGGQPVRINVKSDYPYGNAIEMDVSVRQPAGFPIYVRIPGWAESARLSVGDETFPCKPGEYAKIWREWHTGDVLNVELERSPRITRWFHQSAAVEYGPLLMALPLKEEWKPLNDKPFAPDYEIWPLSDWNYALAFDEPVGEVRFNPKEVGPFGKGRPLTIDVRGVKLDSWGMDGASCADPPIGVSGAAERLEWMTLIPYGSTKLRVGQFPAITIRAQGTPTATPDASTPPETTAPPEATPPEPPMVELPQETSNDDDSET